MSKEKPNYFDYFTKREERNIQIVTEHFSEELDFCKGIFNMLFDAFKSITDAYSEKWTYSKKASFFIIPRLIMSTKTTLELLIRGYYFDYEVIQRGLMESVALLKLLSEDEEAAKKWLAFEKIEIPKWKLMHRLLPPSPAKKATKLVNKMYAQQSDFVHSSFVAIANEWALQLSRRKTYIEFPKFDKSMVGALLSSPFSLMTIMILTEVFREELEESFRMKVMNLVEGKISEWKLRNSLRVDNYQSNIIIKSDKENITHRSARA